MNPGVMSASMGKDRNTKSHGPVGVGQFDLANPSTVLLDNPSAPDGSAYAQGRLLVRFRGEPLGMLTVDLPDDGLAGGQTSEPFVERLRSEAAAIYQDRIAEIEPGWSTAAAPSPNLTADLARVADEELPAVSVVIGTRDRSEQVVECITYILKQEYPSPIEVIVVENGVEKSSTADAIAEAFGRDDRIRFMLEVRPGLSRARNIGLAAARYPVTAFLSDDIQVDPLWMLGIARGFGRHPEVRCVTGICPPLYLDSIEQRWFESAMSWGTRQGFERALVWFDHDDDPLHPYRPARFCNGSNMAVETAAFRRLGGFDEALGPGTIARGGEDLDAPIRLLADGGAVAFEPVAIGWHADRFQDRPFTKLMFTYGMGLTAFLTKHVTDAGHRRAVASRVRHGAGLLLKTSVEPDEELHEDHSIPLRYHLCHLAGRLAGPLAYLRSRRAKRR